MAKDIPNHSKAIDNPQLLEFKSGILTISADAPLPPGSRVAFPLPLRSSDAEIPIVGKIVTSTPLFEGLFRLVIRLNSLSREHRSALIDDCASD